MNDELVFYRKMEGLAWITLNRPKRLNALNPEVYGELDRVLTDCETDQEVKVVIITGNENAFAAGADIEAMAKGDVQLAYRLTDQSQRTQERLADMPKPTIAVIAGYALGGGLELALCCDFRIAGENAILGVPEINLGIIPGGGGTQRLPRLIGLNHATELVLLGEHIKADKAEKWGLINKVVPLDQLERECEKLAKKLMLKSPVALRAAKDAIRTGINTGLKEGLKIEQDIFCMLFGTSDQKEGMAAFLEKRKPNFSGS